jgi:hypothetical protein
MRSRLKCAIFSINSRSCINTGPRGPAVSEFWFSPTGAPARSSAFLFDSCLFLVHALSDVVLLRRCSERNHTCFSFFRSSSLISEDRSCHLSGKAGGFPNATDRNFMGVEETSYLRIRGFPAPRRSWNSGHFRGVGAHRYADAARGLNALSNRIDHLDNLFRRLTPTRTPATAFANCPSSEAGVPTVCSVAVSIRHLSDERA